VSKDLPNVTLHSSNFYKHHSSSTGETENFTKWEACHFDSVHNYTWTGMAALLCDSYKHFTQPWK